MERNDTDERNRAIDKGKQYAERRRSIKFEEKKNKISIHQKKISTTESQKITYLHCVPSK